MKHLIALIFILGCCTVAWFILGATIDWRTEESNNKLQPGVTAMWGAPQVQEAPVVKDGGAVIAPESTSIRANLSLQYRQKGLLWYSAYVVDFSGTYTYKNPLADKRFLTFNLKFPAQQAIYDGLVMEVDGVPMPMSTYASGAVVTAEVQPGQEVRFHTAYRSHGLDRWQYKPGDNVSQSRQFELVMTTDFRDIDFPSQTLSPTAQRQTGSGWELTWKYTNLISGFQIGMLMPQKLQPGPLAGRISYFAPVSLFLFFFMMWITTTRRNLSLHPMNYFFLGAAFFSFHLLFAYLVDHISIHLAFAICSAVSVFLVVSYLRIVAGARFALVEAATAQIFYLVLLSYAFFIPGAAALTVTIGCIVTLFIVMQSTARIRWGETLG